MRIPIHAVLTVALALSLLLGAPIAGADAARAQAAAEDSVAFAGQAPDSTALVRIAQAFRSGDVEALLEGSAERLDVIIFGKGSSYSLEQATLVLTDFFRRNPPARVEFQEEVLAEDRRSMIGAYWVVEGGEEPVSVFVRLRARGPHWQLRSIRVERTNGRR